MQSAAIQSRNHVEMFFCECLLAAVRELLPDDVEPTGADLRATVIVRAVEPQDVQETTPEEELLAVLSQLVDALKVCLGCSSPRWSTNWRQSRLHALWQHNTLHPGCYGNTVISLHLSASAVAAM